MPAKKDDTPVTEVEEVKKEKKKAPKKVAKTTEDKKEKKAPAKKKAVEKKVEDKKEKKTEKKVKKETPVKEETVKEEKKAEKKEGINDPKHGTYYTDVEVSCICGAKLTINTTVPGPIKVETCAECHPAYNKDKVIKKVIKGRLEKFLEKQKKIDAMK